MNNKGDSRRDFLKKAGLVSAGMAILPSFAVKGFSVLHPQTFAAMGTGLMPAYGKWIPVV